MVRIRFTTFRTARKPANSRFEFIDGYSFVDPRVGSISTSSTRSPLESLLVITLFHHAWLSCNKLIHKCRHAVSLTTPQVDVMLSCVIAQVSIPRQSRGPYCVSRSKRLERGR